jgi:hypothetical protein
MRQPRVLVACEYSGIVRDAFAERGWDAWSCDLLPSERPEGQHVQGDVIPLLDEDWDLLVAHPPCTFMTLSGARWLYEPWSKQEKKDYLELTGKPLGGHSRRRDEERWKGLDEGAAFFNIFLHTNIPHVAVENPQMHRHAIQRVGGVATQFVQPFHFGTMESKRTGLRLINLPPLEATNDVEAEMRKLPKNMTDKVHYASPGADRWKERSRTYPAIAQAMADQWGPFIESKIWLQERRAA